MGYMAGEAKKPSLSTYPINVPTSGIRFTKGDRIEPKPKKRNPITWHKSKNIHPPTTEVSKENTKIPVIKDVWKNISIVRCSTVALSRTFVEILSHFSPPFGSGIALMPAISDD